MVVDRNRKAMPVEIPFQVVSGEEREATEVRRFQSAEMQEDSQIHNRLYIGLDTQQ